MGRGLDQCLATSAIDDYAIDGGEEPFTKMHIVLKSNSDRIATDS